MGSTFFLYALLILLVVLAVVITLFWASSPRAFRWLRSLQERILRGKLWTLGFYLLAGLIILGGLFASVHHRDLSDWKNYYPSNRWINYTRYLVHHGYFDYAGMLIAREAGQDGTPPILYQSSPANWMFFSYLVQKVNFWLSGNDFSYTLWALSNQLHILLSAALIGLLGMRLAHRLGLPPPHALILGLICGVIYQTYAANLALYWETYPMDHAALFCVIFLLTEEISYGRDMIPRWLKVVRFGSVFGALLMDLQTPLIGFVSYLMIIAFLRPEALRQFNPVKTLAIPAAIPFCFYALQRVYVSLKFPEVIWVGSSWLFRLGFDGDLRFYKNVFESSLFNVSSKYNLYGPTYMILFAGGTIAIAVLVCHCLIKKSELKPVVTNLIIGVGFFLPFAFLFSQSFTIHPHAYHVYVIVPMVLGLFAVLPAFLEKQCRYSGLIVLMTVMAAFCFATLQIRAYSARFPLPPSQVWDSSMSPRN